MKIGPEKRGHRHSTAGGRELRLKARPPARFSSQAVSQELTSIKDKETKTTVPSGNSYFWHIDSPSNRLPGNSYFWRTAIIQSSAPQNLNGWVNQKRSLRVE
jgi:hypothetical protein